MKRYIASEEVLDEEYDLPAEEQEYTSEKTSINSTKLPAIFHLVNFPKGTLNLDYGGGKFDNAAEYLAEQGATNLVYDPYNRSTEHNRSVVKEIKDAGGADTATLSNVLNVIQEESVRLMCLRNIRRLLKQNGTLYVTVYEGSGTGEGKPTKSGYQRNMKTADYLDEIQQVFPDAHREGKLIICPNTGKIDASRKVKGMNAINGAYERPLEPDYGPEPDEVDATEEIEVDLDGVRITVGAYGDFDYVDWEPEDIDSEEFVSLTLADGQEVIECIDELIIDRIPAEPGEYELSGWASLAFSVTGVSSYKDYYKDEDGDVVYDEEIYTDDADIQYLPDESSIDVKFTKI